MSCVYPRMVAGSARSAAASFEAEREYRLPVYRLALKRERTIRLSEQALAYPAVTARIARAELGDSPHERLLGFFVNNQNAIVGMMVVASTSTGGTVFGVTARGVCQAALAANAAAVILAHNHPAVTRLRAPMMSARRALSRPRSK